MLAEIPSLKTRLFEGCGKMTIPHFLLCLHHFFFRSTYCKLILFSVNIIWDLLGSYSKSFIIGDLNLAEIPPFTLYRSWYMYVRKSGNFGGK